MPNPICSHHFSAIVPVVPAVSHWKAPDFLHRLKQSVQTVGLTTISETSFAFEPHGVSVVLLLAESHVALHCWSELNKLTIDIHVCDFQHQNFVKAQQLTDLLLDQFGDRTQPTTWHYRFITG